MLRFALFFTFCMISLAGVVSGQVDRYKEKRGYGGILLNTPVYDPHSKSYFELVRNSNTGYAGAQQRARKKAFKSVRGRLAIIRSKENQQFLIRTFKPRGEIWIGLRMFCKGRVLFWVDGKRLDRRKDYQNWGKMWHYKAQYLPCKGGAKFAGIVLGRDRSVMRWFAIAPAHFVRHSFIEYPTGRP